MKDLNAFCIGSYCEKIISELHNFEHGEACDEKIIDLAIKPINFFIDYISLIRGYDESLASTLIPDEFTASLTTTIIRLFKGKNDDEIIERFNSVFEVLNYIKEDKQVDITPALMFFNDIAELNRGEIPSCLLN